MAHNLRDLRRKMKAIRSVRQVTKAMELVAASKMRKAVQNAQVLRRYALTAWSILRKVAHVQHDAHPFLQHRPLRKVLCVLITSDRGQCGSFNAHVLRTATQYVQGIEKLGSDVSIEFIGLGRKGQQHLARTGATMIAAFPAFSNHPSFRDILPVGKMVIDGFLSGTYDRVVLIYSDFISALVQEPTVKVLLPFSESELRSMVESLLPRKRVTKEYLAAMDAPLPKTEYVFEPSAGEVLSRVLPQLTELQLYQAILENAASEHSARMVAMRNASENASDLLDDLGLTYNQTRQGIITGELAELSASKAALD